MLRTIQRRILFSQLLVLVIIMPLMGILLVFGLESRFMIPKLAGNLLGDARLLSEISSAEYELWGNPILFEKLISRVQLDPAIKVMFMDSTGMLLFSSDPTDYLRQGVISSAQGIQSAQNGREIALTTYSILRLKNALVDVYEPVTDSSNSVIGIVRLTYQFGSLYTIFGQLRWQIMLVILLGLLVSALISIGLAIWISRPIRKVTQAIYDLAVGRTHEPLEVKGPEELKSQAQAVNFLVAQLDGQEKSRRQLLANLVHELGRPLGSIHAAIHALETGAEKDAKLYQELTSGVDAETTRLRHLLDDLSHLYDQSVGALELNLQAVEPAKWLQGILKPVQVEAGEKGLHWMEVIQDPLPTLTIDPDRMAQVLGNLLNNAIKYTKAGGTITFSAGVLRGQFHITIQDNGIGIQADEQKKVFQPFFRGEQGRQIKQGMGLGLSIAKDLTEAHGGRLELSSRTGQGSTFSIWLPISEIKSNAS